ncbi:uncharacterized protein LOC114303647 [Camellia sinensis]|uniref:uncharacterized protein LOC114303647 n=1 Tax=Camellia sinensis TaxID=4442 RepID=UPI001036076D|nr:uncharacterized protein LOC114303647 [Camellia sinensis]
MGMELCDSIIIIIIIFFFFFCNKTSTSITILLVYVNDILLTGGDSLYISTLIQQMHAKFSMKELGALNYFLGISVSSSFSSSSSYVLSQEKYASDILAKANMSDCKFYASLMAIKDVLSVGTDSLFFQSSFYRSLVGAPQYLTIIQPDHSFSVNHPCQFLQNPLQSHFTTLKRLLRYVKGTLSHGLHFTNGPLVLNAFSNSYWASNIIDKRSTTGHCVFLGPNLVS